MGKRSRADELRLGPHDAGRVIGFLGSDGAGMPVCVDPAHHQGYPTGVCPSCDRPLAERAQAVPGVDPMMTSGDIAKRAGVTPQAVHLWIKTGKLMPSEVTLGGLCLFRQSYIEAWLAERAQEEPGDG